MDARAAPGSLLVNNKTAEVTFLLRKVRRMASTQMKAVQHSTTRLSGKSPQPGSNRAALIVIRYRNVTS